MSLFLYTLVSLQPFAMTFSLIVLLSGLEESARSVGCANASESSLLEIYSNEGGRDLGPAQCCALCLNNGSHTLHGPVFTDCLNASSSGESRDVREEGERQLLRLVQAGETFVVEVHGNLSGSPHQPAGMGEHNLPSIIVHFMDTRSHSSHLGDVLGDGSFVVASDWIIETLSKYEINVRVPNTPSTPSSTLHLLVAPDDLMISVLRGPLGVLSCEPFMQRDSATFPRDPITLQVQRSEGDKDSGGGRSCRTVSFTRVECLKSTVAAVRPAVCDLNVSVSETHLSVYAELFTATSHMLVLNLTLKATYTQNQQSSAGLSNEGEGDNSCMDGNNEMKNKSNTDINNSEASTSGCYNVTVQVFDPVSRTLLQTYILVQDSTGKLVLNTSSVISTKQKLELLFSTTAESDVTVSTPAKPTLLSRTGSYSRGQDAAAVVWLFNQTGTAAVELRAANGVFTQNKSTRVCIEGNRKQPPQVKVNPNWQPPTSVLLGPTDTVRIYAARDVYPTDADVILAAEADVPDPVEFTWHFGDSTSARATSRTVTKRYSKPGRFEVVAAMSAGRTSVTSNAFRLEIQRAVKLNRLVHRASVLQNRTVAVSCRVSAGTNLTFLWSFGDGSSRLGQSTEHHVFHRTGEFRLSVAVSNLVSSASLSSHIFVVDRPCQPPPVKNMGPLQIQVWRHEPVHLGVTYEDELDCAVMGGLRYAWTLVDSAGHSLPLPFVHTHGQSLILPARLLHYGAYVAIARVQVVGSVVYSNYSVRVKVVPSPPVAFIQGGTNVFIRSRSVAMVTLDGRRSYDPDFPLKPLGYSWTCQPVSSITGSCFSRHVPASSPVLTLPVASLKHHFDQFRFTLTVHSGDGERSASSDVFLTMTPGVLGKVSLHLPESRGGARVNWDQEFSVRAWCEDCNAPPDIIQFTWSLYMVNASSRPVTEVPFCDAVDLSLPSTVFEGPSAADPLDSTPVLLRVITSTAGTKQQGEEFLYRSLEESGPSESTDFPGLALDNSDVLYLDHLSDVFSEFPNEWDSSADWGASFPVLEAEDARARLGEKRKLSGNLRAVIILVVCKSSSFMNSDYDAPLASVEEGDPGPSAGRPTGVDGETFAAGEESEVHEDEWSHLVDSRPSVVTQEHTLLDLPRDPVDVGLFESYTYAGRSSSLLSFRPFSLRPGSRYMLEVTAESHNNLLGRTQLFLKTRAAPTGVMCQVQPAKGVELHTHFSIFCASGREDLVYEYSFSVGGRSPRTLYQGRDFQYYFRLPSGDPRDHYKVTVYTEVRGANGAATKPCPVTVQVQPSVHRESSSHHDPALELSASGLRNLSALVQLGNSMEIRNYVSLLSSILNRLSPDTEPNTHTQTRTRSALIGTLCELESRDQQSMEDNIRVLTDVVKIINQVSYVSARRVVLHIQTISDLFLESSAPVQYNLDYKTLSSLITLLSYTLQTAINSPHSSKGVVITQALDSDLRGPTAAPGAFKVHQLAADIHQAASDLMLKYIVFHEAPEHRVSTRFISLYATKRSSTVISSGSTTVYVPASLTEQLFNGIRGESEMKQRAPCLLSVLTEFPRSPFTLPPDATKLSGPVVSLNLYTCGTRRKIHIRSLTQPVDIELQHPQRNMSSVGEYVLHHNRINYHSFNITQEHLQRAIQFSVSFKPLSSTAFPVMLLFRMFDRPTPSMHHLNRTHRWEGNTTRITLPPSYLSAAGMGYLALLNAGKAPKHRHLREQISYSLAVDSSLCLSWDDQQGSWTRRGCRTQQADAGPTVGCSCHQLQPLTVVQQHLEGSHDSADLGPFISVSGDPTLPAVLLLAVCLYVLGLAPCRRADAIAEQSQQVRPLPDNSPSDPHHYAVTVHTGLSSAACMSAKVYIVLYGEDGRSQTREIQVPGCTLFRRNSQDTFVLSTAASLGPVWGVHIWHDNSGPSPDWYLSRVEVSEVEREQGKGRSWLFVGRCWLTVSKGDGQVERMLRVCTGGMSFAEMLRLKLPDYLADLHIWISVLCCPCPHPFTLTQRLTVCLLLLLGYSCVNAVIVSQMDNQLPFELGATDVSAVSVTTGVLSVLAVLPVATAVSFLFRWREGSGAKRPKRGKTEKDYFEDDASVNNIIPESHSSCTGEAWIRKLQTSVSTRILENKESAFQADEPLRKADALTSGLCTGPVLQNVLAIPEEKRLEDDTELKMRTRNENHKAKDSRDEEIWSSGHGIISKGGKPSQWCRCLAWTLCLLLSLSCLLVSAVLGTRFSSSKALLWIHSLFVSLTSCIFFIQPVMTLVVAVTASLWYRTAPDFHSFSCITELELEALKLHSCRDAFGTKEQFSSSALPQEHCPYFEELLRARRRARYLRLVRPPTPAQLKKTRGKRRREALMCDALRDLSVCVSMLLLMLCITYGSSFHDHYHLNKLVRRRFVRHHDNELILIQKPEDWWTWMQSNLLSELYKNVSAKTEQPCILFGEPVVWKMEASCSIQGQVSGVNIGPEWLHSFLSRSRTLTYLNSNLEVSKATSPSTCGLLNCHSVGLGQTKSDAASRLRRLHSDGWLNERTLALKVQFTLYSPAANLFTSVMLVTGRRLAGVLRPSANVQSVTVYRTPAACDYAAMICQLVFLLLSLLQLCRQVKIVTQQGLMGYCRTPFHWLEIALLTVTLLHYVYYIHRSVLTMEAAEQLQRRSYAGCVDVNSLAACEHDVRTLHGLTLFLLTMKCVALLRVSRTTASSAALISHSLSSLFWPLISGLIPLVALSCVGNLLFAQNSSFNSIPRSLRTLLLCCWGPRPVRSLLLSGYELIYVGGLYLCSTIVWTAVMRSIVSSIVRRSRRSLSGRTLFFTVAELASSTRQKFSEIVLQQRPTWTENHMGGRTYYLEEFEGLVDELLLRLNTLSNNLHHETQCYMEEDPVVSPVQPLSSVYAWDFARLEMIDETKMTHHTDAISHGKNMSASHLLRLKLELELLQLLQQGNQNKSTRAPRTKLVVEALVHEEHEAVASPEKLKPCEED
ncbi:polycystic kidney disease 1 like 1 isoform X2 [Betta splendens]|uniref:Polycystic kidney disease 1 like 1 isoform X2 n=1 Tax=Betta splendens TaxID=158456 RepID=A0A9W2XPV7_BETSP|nr:polycystic kidney disease 1 like 1 isoform X2 [Betta splendens]